MSLHPLLRSILPQQQTGNSSNTSTKKKFSGEAKAREFYALVSDRLHNVNEWHNFAGAPSASFQLFDGQRKPINRQAQEGDYFEIDIPGPGNQKGGGKDWVRVEKTGQQDGDDATVTFMQVRSAAPPGGPQGKPAHFFSASATSTFAVLLDGETITAGVYGRNEKPNTRTSWMIDKIRNFFTAVGAILGFSKLQWKALTTGLLADDPSLAKKD